MPFVASGAPVGLASCRLAFGLHWAGRTSRNARLEDPACDEIASCDLPDVNFDRYREEEDSMPNPRDCTTMNPNNRTAALNRVPRRNYGPIAVTITRVVGNKIYFDARGTDGNRHEHVAPWGNEHVMWPYCPSTLPSWAVDPGPGPGPGNPGPPPAVNAAGTLYLAPSYCVHESIDVGPDLNLFSKWPDKLAVTPPSATIRVKLKTLVLDGIALRAAGVTVELDLLDRALVPGQVFELGDGNISLRLTSAGFDMLGIPMHASGIALIAPAHLYLEGVQLENGLESTGAVDLMDLASAPRRQRIDLEGELTEVRLTQLGFTAFDVVFSKDAIESDRSLPRSVKTVTVLAADPSRQQTDPVIEMVRAKLQSRDAATHDVFDASSVEELAAVLRKLSEVPGGMPDRIEVVGHGYAGALSLGYYFTDRSTGGPRGPHYILDSDPNVYGILNKPMKPDAEVLLLGCAVGDIADGPQPLVADGATLVFDLAQLWDCKVSAPVNLISADDFDAQGRFASHDRLQSVLGTEFTRATRPAKLAATPGARKPMIGFTSVQMKGGTAVAPIPDEVSEELNRIFDQPIELPDILAVPEATFEATCDGKPATVEMLVNGRILRMRYGGEVRHVAARSGEIDRARRIVREAHQPGYKPAVRAMRLTKVRRAAR